MTTAPTRIAQTSREAQREYKKHGARVSEQQQRQLERAIELDLRAARLREQEERKRTAKKRREERERKERNARQQLGVGLATQLVGYNHTQAKLKNGMESFLGLKRRREEEEQRDLETKKKLELIAELVEKEPWDPCDGEEPGLDDLSHFSPLDGESIIYDEVDDESLLEAHNLVVSGAAENVLEPAPAPPCMPTSVEPHPKRVARENADFLRLHGPIDKIMEKALEKLPEPLIELLSIDTSINTSTWDPAPALLHKLNPVGVPPHRLRIKVGCTVVLLQDFKANNVIAKDCHLRILRVINENIECQVLDGKFEGTKMFLTKVSFSARYRNDETLLFGRLQFPIRVAVEFTGSGLTRKKSQLSSMSCSVPRPLESACGFKESTWPPSKQMSPPLPGSNFKLPTLPVSRPTRTLVSKASKPVSAVVIMDDWNAFFDSGTQIAREISSEESKLQSRDLPEPVSEILVTCLDFDFELDDLDGSLESYDNHLKSSREVEATSANPSSLQLALVETRRSQSPPQARRQSTTDPPVNPLPKPVENRNHIISTRKTPPTPVTKPSPYLNSEAEIPTDTFISLNELGLSTQDALSLLDDVDFSSPTIAV